MDFIFEKEEYYKFIAEAYGEAEETINSFRELDKNWDSYKAKSIDPDAIELAKIIVKYIIDFLVEFPFAIFPTADGGISLQIEFVEDRQDISRMLLIDIYKDKIKLFLQDDTTETSEFKKITQIKDLVEIKNYLNKEFKYYGKYND